jgi:PleD family two-component response regulator
VSVGVACRSGQVETPSALLRSADAAMYRAKRAGGDRVVLSVAGSADADAASTVPTAS